MAIDAIQDVTYPLATGGTGATRMLSDAAREGMASVFAADIRTRLGDAWAWATTALPPAHPLRGTRAVETVLQLAPTPDTLGAMRIKFPALAIYREGDATYARRGLKRLQRTQNWGVEYMLGPIGIDDARVIGDACLAAADIIFAAIENRGMTAGVGWPIPVASIYVSKSQGPGWAAVDGQPAPYWGISLSVTTTEVLHSHVDSSDVAFTGANVSVDLTSPYETVTGGSGVTIADFVQDQTAIA